MNDKIFISIPSYEDENLVNTIKNALENAKEPEKLVFGIALQYQKLTEPNLDFISSQSRIIRYHVSTRPGLIRIRKAIADLIDDEKYFLGIDAHSTFSKDWDYYLKRDHEFLSRTTNNPRIVIGERISSDRYRPDENINIMVDTGWKMQESPFGIAGIEFDTPPNKIDNIIHNVNRPEDIIYAKKYFVSANFWFTTSDFHKNNLFPVYHNIVYEEPELSIALYVNGYDMYYPLNRHFVYAPDSETTNRQNSIHWKKSWNDVFQKELYEKNWVGDQYPMAEEVFKLLVLGECQHYSFKNRIRSVDQYWSELGFSDIIKKARSKVDR